MLGSADPRVAGRDVTVASVLDAASARVESELAGQPDVKAEVLTTLGTTYQGLGLYAPAKERLRAALEASRAAFGPEHVEVARALDRLAGAFEDEGDLQEAERLDRESLAMLGRLGETEGKDAAQVKGDLARVLQGLGQERRSGGALPRGAGDRAAARGRPRARRWRRRSTTSASSSASGATGPAAEPLHREALDIIRSVRGPEHPDVAAGMNTLGGALEAKGDLAGAERLYRESLDMRRRLLGPEHPDTTRSMYALAYLLRAKGDHEGAARLGREILALRGRVLPDAHPMVAGAMQITGHEPRGPRPRGRGRAACCARAWSCGGRRSRRATGSSPRPRARSAPASRRRAASARPSPFSSTASRVSKAARGEEHALTVEARQRLVALYEAWGRPDRAAAWRGASR